MTLHGKFLQRQHEVSNDFAEYFTDKVLHKTKLDRSKCKDLALMATILNIFRSLIH